jgi:hypothetical protein
VRGCLSCIVGFAAFIAAAMGIGHLLGPTTCRDGWESPSIGQRGACSHHGGVDRSGDFLVWVAGALGVGAGFIFYASRVGRWVGGESWGDAGKPYQPPKYEPPLPRPFIPPRSGEPDCPKCGSAMRRRLARRGRHKGKHFWGCSRFPDCNGTRGQEEGSDRAKRRSLPPDSTH